jgi:hypothetical protein
MIALSPLVLVSPAVLAADPSPSTSVATPSPVSGNCGMQLGGTAIFCETFDKKNPGIPSRTGDLDPNVWGVSRAAGAVNFGQGEYNGWAAATQLQTCNGTITVSPPHDVMICNGQLHEASNDNPTGAYGAGGVTTLAMYPKQPFDFAGRTGTVSFDISNDSHGTHSAWPEFWMSNLPVPAPFNHFDSWQALPQHGFGVRFGAAVAPGASGSCQNSNNLDKRRWTVDSAVIVRNYVMDDTNGLGGVRTNMAVQQLDCVISPPDNSGITNHIELKISQNKIDVYATDAGVVPSPSTLRHIAVITNANLSLTRGLIWLADVHYNADEGESGPNVPSQKQHTFVWDNVAFDGPFTYRDFSYDSLDVIQLNAATSTVNLGKLSLANQTASWNVVNIPANPQAGAVRVLFNFCNEFSPVPTVLKVVVNGHAHPTPWPYPDRLQNTWRTFAVTIPITDLVPGTNVVQLGSDQAMVTSNVNIVLVDVPGGVPVLPGSNNAYPAGGGSVGGNPGGATAPTVAISANPTSITSGKISTVNWSSTNATSCTAAGGWNGTKLPNGTFATTPTSTTTYAMTCAGAGGTSPVASTTVAVSAPVPVAVNGACGSANGTTVSSAPSTNLCSTGTSSSVAGSGPWTWSCGGSSGGTTASCSAVASASVPPPTSTPGPVSGNCGMQLGGKVAFCDMFDNKNPGIPSRNGDLDPNVWGVSRTAGDVNFGQSHYNAWAPTQLQTCAGTANVTPPNDIMICNGQLHEASNDNPSGVFEAGGVQALAMYPKQPFDFAGRTGTVSFDVSNDSHGTHAAWPELWMSNLPVPVPFSHFAEWQTLPQHGFGIRFAAQAVAGQFGLCPNGNNINSNRWTIDSGVVVRNYVMEDVNYQGVDYGTASNPPLKLNILDCVIAPADGSGIMNHIEVRVSQTEIDVYATDAGVVASPATLRKIASFTNANLTFTRGLVWLEDAHYNADKGGAPSEKMHTFIWDNVAFDGPFTYRDFSYDALDGTQLNVATNTINLGKFSPANQTASWNVLNIPSNPQGSAVRVLFNFSNEVNPVPTVLNVVVNGHAHPTPWPYPDTLTHTWRTFAVTIPITDLVPGTNVVQLGSDQPMVSSNVNIVLVEVPGGVPVLPGSNNTYP